MLLLFDKLKLRKFDVGNSFYWNKIVILKKYYNRRWIVFHWLIDQLIKFSDVGVSVTKFDYLCILLFTFTKKNTCCTLIVLVFMQVFKQIRDFSYFD